MKKAAIIGISGKMGAETLALAQEYDFEITAGVARTAAVFEGVSTVTSVAALNPQDIDVVIDFSSAGMAKSVVQWCAVNGRPLVSGVTGLGNDERAAFATLSRAVPVFWAPNMSLGIAVLRRMLAQAGHLKNFDFQIEETHHRQKKDSPSGTALLLQETLQDSMPQILPAPISIRGGGVFGVHRVFALGEEETLTFEHTAMNRRVFARGALQAARWLMNQGPGLYSMDQMLGT